MSDSGAILKYALPKLEPLQAERRGEGAPTVVQHCFESKE